MVVEIPFFRSREPVRENERIVRPRVVSGATIPVVLGRGGQGGEQDGRGVGGGRGGGRRSYNNDVHGGGYRGGHRGGHRGGRRDGYDDGNGNGLYNHRGGDVGFRDHRDNGQINQGYYLDILNS